MLVHLSLINTENNLNIWSCIGQQKLQNIQLRVIQYCKGTADELIACGAPARYSDEKEIADIC